MSYNNNNTHCYYYYSQIENVISSVTHVATLTTTKFKQAWRIIFLPLFRFILNEMITAGSILIPSLKYTVYTLYDVLRYVIVSTLTLIDRLILKPVRIYFTILTKFTLLPINVPLNILLGTSLGKLAVSARYLISNYIIVTLFQYFVTLTALALSIGVSLGVVLAWSNKSLQIPDLVIDFNKLLYIDRVVSYLRATVARYRLQMALFNEFADIVYPGHNSDQNEKYNAESANGSETQAPSPKVKISGQKTPVCEVDHKQIPRGRTVKGQSMAYLTPVNSHTGSDSTLDSNSSGDQWAECTSILESIDSDGKTLRVTARQIRQKDWKLHSDFELRGDGDDDDLSSMTLHSRRKRTTPDAW